jgi:hypothetical protein
MHKNTITREESSGNPLVSNKRGQHSFAEQAHTKSGSLAAALARAIRDVDGANAAVPEERRNCPRIGTPISLPGSSLRVGILTRTGEPSSVLKKGKHIVILYYASA